MEVRSLLPSDQETIATWSALRNWQVPPDRLPKNGFIVDDLCAGWVYQTDSTVAILEPLISNPLANKLRRTEALDELIDHMIKWSQAQGFKHQVVATNHPGVIKRGPKLGFEPLDSSFRLFWRSN